MRIIFAKNLGFCSGVKRAILIAENSLKKDPKPVQFLGNLVHNEKLIKEFKKKGIKFRKNLKEVKPGTLVIQAHGMPPLPKIAKKKLLIRDTTCPLIRKAQLIASSLFKNNYRVIIIGDRNHSETKGIKGYAKNKAIIIENQRQIKNLKKFQKIGVMAQTTQSSDNVNQILKVLKRKYKKLRYFNTLCPEVQARQKELNLILKKVNKILVIGSRSSANTKRLVRICKKSKKPIWWLNSLEELKKKRINNSFSLGIVSGTSASNQEIEKIKKYLLKNDKKKRD